MNNSIQFTTRMTSRNACTTNGQKPITKSDRFNLIINELKERKSNASELLTLFSKASASKKFDPGLNISEDNFEHLNQLAKNSSKFFIKDFTAGFVKILSIAYIALKGEGAFVKDNNGVYRLDPYGFKNWLSENSSIKSNQIPDKYIYGITMDQDKEVTFGRKNYKNCRLNISDIFIATKTPESTAPEAPAITPIEIKAKKPVKGGVFAPKEFASESVSRIIFPDGVYIGETLNRKRHGSGTFFFNSGDIYRGIWNNNCEDGEGTFITTQGFTCECTWKNGKIIKTTPTEPAKNKTLTTVVPSNKDNSKNNKKIGSKHPHKLNSAKKSITNTLTPRKIAEEPEKTQPSKRAKRKPELPKVFGK